MKVYVFNTYFTKVYYYIQLFNYLMLFCPSLPGFSIKFFIFRIAEVGAVLWFPCVLWNTACPEKLWFLNPRCLLQFTGDAGGLASILTSLQCCEVFFYHVCVVIIALLKLIYLACFNYFQLFSTFQYVIGFLRSVPTGSGGGKSK